MTVDELLAKLRFMPKGAELLAFEPGCEEYCEREIDDVEWMGHRVYLHLGLRRDDRRHQAVTRGRAPGTQAVLEEAGGGAGYWQARLPQARGC